MTTTTITGEINDPSGTPLAGIIVTAELVSEQGAYLADDTTELASRVSTTTDAAGEWSLALTPNTELEPVGTGYRVTRLINGRAQVNTITVPVSVSPVEFNARLTDAAVAGGLAAGGVLSGYYPNPTFADADMTALAGLGDGYPQRSSGTWSARSASQVAADLASPLSSALQPLDADLTAIAALSPTNDDVVQRKAGAWTNRTMAQLAADLAPGTSGLDARYGRVFTPQAYGAAADGSTDDAAAFQAAVTAAETAAASGAAATVYIDGTFRLNNASYPHIALSRNNDGSRGWVNILGAPGAKITLTSNTNRFLYLSKTADYDTFQKIRVEGLQIVASGTAGYGGVIIGNVLSGGGTSTRLNFADIIVRNCTATGLFEQADTSTSQRMGVMLIGNHPSTLEATRTSTTDILIEDVAVYGGAGCANVCSYGVSPGVTHYYNNIRMRRVRHEIATPPATNGSQTSFFICGSGFGDYCEIVDAYSKNVSDDAVEIGAMQTVHLERVRAVDPFFVGILFRNYHAAQDIQRQVLTAVDVVVTGTTVGAAAASDGFNRCLGFAVLDDGNGYGTIRLIRPQYYLDGGSTTHGYPAAGSQLFGVSAVSVKQVEIISPKIVLNNYVINRSTSHEVHLVYFQSTATAPKLVVRDLVARFDGLTQSGSAQVNMSLVRAEGTCDVDIDGVDVVVPAITFPSGSFRIVDLGRTTTSVISAKIRGVRPVTGTVSGVSIYGVAVNSTSTLTVTGEVVVANCEFAGMANSSADVQIDSTQVGKVRVLACGFRAGHPASASVSPGASPYTYTNLVGYPKQVSVAGGTVSAIDVAGPTGSFVTTGLTSGVFTARPGGRVRITYTVAPTVVEVSHD